ncbi:multiheme c-type cytochrome [Geomonas ferrireducens]|uniref:multiheme c-type cytochrome n=1 Tax=Geomonas ferrireducens TaxID=2570227 RepID=UPI001FE2A7C1|nr:multiheme c-type cytochrome [Geomonas ferrireducens]
MMIRAVLTATILAALIAPRVSSAAEPCIPCHTEKTPAAVAQWQGSAHAKAGVGCEKCHGSDHDKIVRGEAKVGMKVCAPCHKKAYEEHRLSRHGMGLHSGWGCTRGLPDRKKDECRFCHQPGDEMPRSDVQCARFLKQSPEMGEIGCNYCHSVEDACDSCHSKHMTDLKIVRDPNSCAKCHMGPDHPQWEMWQTSLHGTLNVSAGAKAGPDCQTCHMPKGTHNVSIGITMNSGGVPYPAAKAEPARKEMVNICSACHAPAFAKRELERGDLVRTQSLAILKEAEHIIWDLNDRGLLDPMPENRPQHPLSGPRLVTDSQMLYEDTSHIERLFFKMKKYDYARTVKGAYHQNPSYTHWYGNAELKMDLVDIKSEASRLKERGQKGAGVKPQAGAEDELKALKNKFDRGALSAEEYAKEKGKVLEQMK